MADKKVLAGAAGLFDPILRQLAQRLAQSVSPDSPLRTEGVESLIGAVKGFAEVYAERFPALSAVAVEKATDFADFLAVFLAEDGGLVKTQGLLKNFLADAAERLKKAADPKVEFERINLELGFIKDIARTAAQKPEIKDSPTALALTESLGRLNQSLEKTRDWLKKPKEADHGGPD
ncbi:MAG: hypothetical protein WAP55_00275 [Minisyncoccia bacterium]